MKNNQKVLLILIIIFFLLSFIVIYQGLNDIHKMGGIKQIIIKVGIDIKDTIREIIKH